MLGRALYRQPGRRRRHPIASSSTATALPLGWIEILFTTPQPKAAQSPAGSPGRLDERLVQVIDGARSTIDLAGYDIELDSLAAALGRGPRRTSSIPSSRSGGRSSSRPSSASPPTSTRTSGGGVSGGDRRTRPERAGRRTHRAALGRPAQAGERGSRAPTKPTFLFLDEPTSGLDPGNERELMELLQALARGGRIVIVVTHSTQSLDLCDRVIFLAPGGQWRIRAAGAGARVLRAPCRGAELRGAVHAARRDPRCGLEGVVREGRPLQAIRRQAGRGGCGQGAGRRVEDPSAARAPLVVAPALGSRSSKHRTDRERSPDGCAPRPPGAVLGFLFSLVARGPAEGVFTTEEGAQGAILIWLLIVGAVWLGISNSIREIVKEFPIYGVSARSGSESART